MAKHSTLIDDEVGMKTGIYCHADFLEHEMGFGHPECPDRVSEILNLLKSSESSRYHFVEDAIPLASKEDVLRVHSELLWDYLEKNSPQFGYFEIDADTRMNSRSFKAARRAIGAALQAVDSVMSKEHQNAFCVVRPPGHHAEPLQSMGFCFFNTVAIAAKYALEKYSLSRVAIIDFDVHHGNGTEKVVLQDDRILMLSYFQHPFYPYSGTDLVVPNAVNVPVSAKAGSAQIRDIIRSQWLPSLTKFNPEFVFISAGFDAHREDPLGQLELLDEDYYWMTQQLKKLAQQLCEGRMVSCLEGGYNLSALARSAYLHAEALSENSETLKTESL